MFVINETNPFFLGTLLWHLEHNYVPPISDKLPFTLSAIELMREEKPDEPVEAEEAETGRKAHLADESGKLVTASQLVAEYHLDFWVDHEAPEF